MAKTRARNEGHSTKGGAQYEGNDRWNPWNILLKTGYNIALVSAESARARAQEIS